MSTIRCAECGHANGLHADRCPLVLTDEIADLQRQLEETRAKLEAARGEARTWRDVGSAIAFERNAERARADEECARADGFSALAKMLEVDLKKERARAEWAERNTVLQEQLTRDARDERDAAIQRAERAEAAQKYAERWVVAEQKIHGPDATVEYLTEGKNLLDWQDEANTLRRKGEGLATALRLGLDVIQRRLPHEDSTFREQMRTALADWEKP